MIGIGLAIIIAGILSMLMLYMIARVVTLGVLQSIASFKRLPTRNNWKG